MPLRVCSLRAQEHSAEAACSEGLPGLPGPPRGGGHSPLADRLAALEVRRQVAHTVHSFHQFPQVRLDLVHGADLQAQLVHHRDEELRGGVCNEATLTRPRG